MMAPTGKGGDNALAQAFLSNSATQPTAGTAPALPEIQRPTRPALNFGSMAPAAPQQAASGWGAKDGYAGFGYQITPNGPTMNAPKGFSTVVSPSSGRNWTLRDGMSPDQLAQSIALYDNQAARRQQWGGRLAEFDTPQGTPYDRLAMLLGPQAGGQTQAQPPAVSQAQMRAQAINNQYR